MIRAHVKNFTDEKIRSFGSLLKRKKESKTGVRRNEDAEQVRAEGVPSSPQTMLVRISDSRARNVCLEGQLWGVCIS